MRGGGGGRFLINGWALGNLGNFGSLKNDWFFFNGGGGRLLGGPALGAFGAVATESGSGAGMVVVSSTGL